MEFYETVLARRSCRSYTDAPVSDVALTRILEAFRRAPSWKNSQGWHLICVQDTVLKQKLGEALNQNPTPTAYAKAPYIFVLCADPSVSGDIDGKPYYMVDCGIALEHFCLAASAEGLGTCWVGLFGEEPVKKLLHIPENLRVVAVTPLGVPGENPYREKPRREISDILHKNVW